MKYSNNENLFDQINKPLQNNSHPNQELSDVVQNGKNDKFSLAIVSSLVATGSGLCAGGYFTNQPGMLLLGNIAITSAVVYNIYDRNKKNYN